MFKNYLIVAIRILLRNKLFSAINLGGLTIGMTAAFLIILFVRNEVGYDRWIPESERIYTIEVGFNPPGRAPKTLARSPLEFKAAMEQEFPEIESFTRFYAGTAAINMENMKFAEPALVIEETFFDIFDFSFKEGSATTALASGQAVILSTKLAEKYFPGELALGKVITEGTDDYTVTGVLDEFPGKSHLDFEILFYDSPGALNIDFVDWTSSRIYSYFKLSENASIDRLRASTNDFLDKNAIFAPESWQAFTPSDVMSIKTLPIADIHLFQSGESPISPAGSATLVYGFMGIATLIMVMAGINFINLSTANASTREKEIAIRKLVGAKRQQLIIRYMAESLFLVSIAFLCALTMTELLTPFVFNWIGISGFDGTELEFDFLIIAAITSLVTGVLAALYPAIHLSGKSPASAFSGGRSQSPKVARFRLGLILLQYTISIVLVIAASHFYLQTRYAMTLDLGFDSKNVVSYWGISGAENYQAQQSLLSRVRAIPSVSSATRMVQVPGSDSQNNVSLKSADSDSSENIPMIHNVAAGVDFDKTLGLTLLAGRSFEQGRTVDILTVAHMETAKTGGTPASIIINEMAVSYLGFSSAEEAIGKSYRMQDYMTEPVLVQIIGVMKNAHFQSIHSGMVPMIYTNLEPFFRVMVVKLDESHTKETLQAIDALWEQYIPNVPVLRTYLTDDLAEQYVTEDRMTQVFGAFSALAVVIAFLGIFGLAAFSVERRTKEVGIRKVMGARIMDIVRLFVWQFSKPVIWASLLAWPISALIIQDWLQHYAYRINLAPLVFLSAAVTVLFIAWMTVASHAARVARTNPILALRHE